MGQTIVIPAKPVSIPHLNRYLDCILGGAAGDALGYPIEYHSFAEVQRRYGENGITLMETDREDDKASISANTQMTLFTIDGLLTAFSKISARRALSSTWLCGARLKRYILDGLIDEKTPPQEAFEKIGGELIAENVLAGAVYCSLKAKDFRSGVLMAVNYGGGSVASVCGNILGARYRFRPGWID